MTSPVLHDFPAGRLSLHRTRPVLVHVHDAENEPIFAQDSETKPYPNSCQMHKGGKDEK